MVRYPDCVRNAVWHMNLRDIQTYKALLTVYYYLFDFISIASLHTARYLLMQYLRR